MTEGTTRPDLLGYIRLIALAGIWGSSFTFIKIALADLGPLTIAFSRIALAALLLALLARMQGLSWPQDRKTWGYLIALGLIGSALPFFLIGWGEHTVDSGLTAVLMSIVPLIVPIMAHFITDDEKMTPFMGVGIVIGFVGLIVLVGPETLTNLGRDTMAQLAIVSAAFCYASASFIARHIRHLPFQITAAGSLGAAALILFPFMIFIEQPWQAQISLTSLGSIIYLGLFPTAVANILLLTVIRQNGVSFIALNNYLVPVFGVGIAALTLGEQIPAEMLTALVIIFSGIFLSSFGKKKKPPSTSAPES